MLAQDMHTRPEGLTNLMVKAEMELRRTTAQRRATTYMFVASIAAAVSRSPRASRLMSPSVADDRRKESPAKAGLSQEEPSNVGVRLALDSKLHFFLTPA